MMGNRMEDISENIYRACVLPMKRYFTHCHPMSLVLAKFDAEIRKFPVEIPMNFQATPHRAMVPMFRPTGFYGMPLSIWALTRLHAVARDLRNFMTARTMPMGVRI